MAAGQDVTAPGSAGGMSLSVVNGRAALAVGRRDLASLASLEQLELEIPSVRLPADLAAPPERFRNRRCRLQSAAVAVDQARLTAALSRDALAQAGIAELRVTLAAGQVVLRGRAVAGDRQADFTARALLSPVGARRVRVAVDDVRLYGFLPLPAPLLGAAILGATPLGTPTSSSGRSSARWTADVDALDLALYETFAAGGWRLPDFSTARLKTVTVAAGGISLAWAADALQRPGDADEITATGTPPPFEEAEGLLARGDFAGALAAYRKAVRAGSDQPSDMLAEARALQLLLANPATLPEAEAQVARMMERWPALPILALAGATIAAERGDAAGAAGAYARAAALAERAGETEDAALGRLVAAREWMRVGQPASARPLLEAVLAEHPDDSEAAELFAACTTDLTATISEAEAPRGAAPDVAVRVVDHSVTVPMSKLAVALAEADHAEAGDHHEAAAAALRRAIDLTSEGGERAELARRLAAVCERQGDEEGAMAALRLLLEAAPPGPQVAGAWRRLVELHARRGDPQAAARALIASADDARTGSSEQERGAALVAAAEILRKRLGLPGDAAILLERAIALDPHSGEALEAMEVVAVEAGDWERLAEVLARKIDVVARGPVEQTELLVRLAEVYDQRLARADRARDTHERALQVDPAFRPSLLWLARDAWVRGDGRAATDLYRRLAAAEEGDPRLSAADREEIHVRLGALARRSGDDGTAERELERALADAPDSAAALDLMIELYEAQARHAELAEALGRRAASDLAVGARAELQRRQAAALERAGQLTQAAALWRTLADGDDAALPALLRLAATARETGDQAALAAVLEPLGEVLTAKGELDEADRVLAARIELASDDNAAAALTTERARLRLMGPGGAAAALAVLREVPLGALPEEGLVLRADLGERQRSLDDALPALDELLTRTRAAGQSFAAQEIEARIAELTARAQEQSGHGEHGGHADGNQHDHGEQQPGSAPPASVEDLEQLLTTDPTDAAAAEELAGMYSQIADPHHRVEALSGLLRRALGLSPDRRKTIYAALGQSAEQSGDLERAEQAYWRAATIEAEPALRANYLVAHARVLLARGEVQTAISELEEAISRVPLHAGALALLADLTYRTQDWPRARQLYAELEAAPDAADVIARELLVHRRAVLAEAQGDTADAEAFYRELAILNPRHAEARRALAEIALGRGDFGAAALRLEEVLRLLPLEALDQLLDVRQRIGAVYVQLGDWGSARYYLELVVAQDPSRIPALELLVEVYERLGLYKEAGQACARLSRLYFEPSRRAAILYRQGEILRAHLGDENGAFDAFLKSSDLDPRFVPTMVRLVQYFWAQGDLEALADVAGDLAVIGFSPGDDVELAVHLAIATALAPTPPPAARWSLQAHRFDAALAARALADAAGRPAALAPEKMDPALAPILAWAGDAAPALEQALAAAVAEDPAHVGALRVLGRLAERADRRPLARAAYALLAYLDPADPAAQRLATLGAAPSPPGETLRIGGAADHAACDTSLRRALAGLAVPLLGFGQPPAATPTEETALRLARAAGLRRVAEQLGAPAFVTVVDRAEQARAAVNAAPTRPVTLRITGAAAELPERVWGFVVARALEEARSGVATVRGLTAAEVNEVLSGALAALTGGTPDDEKALAVAVWLSDAEPAAALPSGAARQALIDDLRAAVESARDWETFLHAWEDTANRLALLVCGSPADALAALASEDVLLQQGDVPPDAARRGFLRTTTVRELVAFMLSPDYERAVGEKN